jgi:DHA1 family tetracycline resistance protein-like MFS transporter
MNRPLIVIFTAIVLDAIGIGLIFPILPSLLQEVTHTQNVAPYIGTMTALYAVMQFIFAPVLGALSDRLGRRPVLLISLGGAAINYLFLAFASNLWMLLIGRAIAGLTSANIAVAMAYITDISAEDQARPPLWPVQRHVRHRLHHRPRSRRRPWRSLAAAAVHCSGGAERLQSSPGLLHAAGITHANTRDKIDLGALNPLRPLRWVFSMKSVLPIIFIFFIFSATGEAYGTCWALWGSDAFHWNGLWIGLSLGAFGVCQTLAQAFLPGPAVKLLGERTAILTGVTGTCIALIVMAFATESWMIFAIMPVFRAWRHRRAGAAVSRDPAGRREPARPVPGRAGLGCQPRLDRGPAGLLELLLRLQATMARRDLAIGRRRLRDWHAFGAWPAIEATGAAMAQ